MSGYANLLSSYTPAMWWKCDEASGTTLADASGNSRTGAITGTVKYGLSGGSGDGSSGIALDGSTAYFRAAAYAPFTASSTRTFVLLLRADLAQSSSSGIKNIFGGSGTYVAGVSDDLKFPVLETSAHPTLTGVFNFRWYHNIATQFPLYKDWENVPLPTGRFVHIVLTVDDSQASYAAGMALWVNGVSQGPPTLDSGFGSWGAPFPAEAGRFMTGVRYGAAGENQANEFHQATYSHVAIFTRILTNAEITALAAERYVQTVTLRPTVRSALTGAGRGQ